MDPVTATTAARDTAGVARADRVTSDELSARTGGVSPTSTSFKTVLEAAAEGRARSGVAAGVTAAERHEQVAGHRYVRVTAGVREGSYVNTSGNARHGEAFALVERGGRTFHVYGEGADRRIVEIRRATRDPAAPTAADPSVAATPAATTLAPTTTTTTATVQDPDVTGDGGGLEAPEDDAR